MTRIKEEDDYYSVANQIKEDLKEKRRPPLSSNNKDFRAIAQSKKENQKKEETKLEEEIEAAEQEHEQYSFSLKKEQSKALSALLAKQQKENLQNEDKLELESKEEDNISQEEALENQKSQSNEKNERSQLQKSLTQKLQEQKNILFLTKEEATELQTLLKESENEEIPFKNELLQKLKDAPYQKSTKSQKKLEESPFALRSASENKNLAEAKKNNSLKLQSQNLEQKIETEKEEKSIKIEPDLKKERELKQKQLTAKESVSTDSQIESDDELTMQAKTKASEEKVGLLKEEEELIPTLKEDKKSVEANKNRKQDVEKQTETKKTDEKSSTNEKYLRSAALPESPLSAEQIASHSPFSPTMLNERFLPTNLSKKNLSEKTLQEGASASITTKDLSPPLPKEEKIESSEEKKPNSKDFKSEKKSSSNRSLEAETAAAALTSSGASQATSFNQVQSKEQNLESRSLSQLIEELVEQIMVIKNQGQTDTVITLRSPKLLEGATIKISTYEQAPGEVNIAFANLTPAAKKILDDKLAKQSLIKSLKSKTNITVHNIITTTQPEVPNSFSLKESSDESPSPDEEESDK